MIFNEKQKRLIKEYEIMDRIIKFVSSLRINRSYVELTYIFITKFLQ
jgi:hypothetical protein